MNAAKEACSVSSLRLSSLYLSIYHFRTFLKHCGTRQSPAVLNEECGLRIGFKGRSAVVVCANERSCISHVTVLICLVMRGRILSSFHSHDGLRSFAGSRKRAHGVMEQTKAGSVVRFNAVTQSTIYLGRLSK
jgi:hypothetical protein